MPKGHNNHNLALNTSGAQGSYVSKGTTSSTTSSIVAPLPVFDFKRPSWETVKQLTDTLTQEYIKNDGDGTDTQKLKDNDLSRNHVLSFSDIRNILSYALASEDPYLVKELFEIMPYDHQSVPEEEREKAKKLAQHLIDMMNDTDATAEETLVASESLLRTLNSCSANLSLGHAPSNSQQGAGLDVRLKILGSGQLALTSRTRSIITQIFTSGFEEFVTNPRVDTNGAFLSSQIIQGDSSAFTTKLNLHGGNFIDPSTLTPRSRGLVEKIQK